MDGITILSSNEITYEILAMIFCIPLFTISIILACFFFIDFIYKKQKCLAIVELIFFFTMVFSGACILVVLIDSSYTEYKITIDEDVNFLEFYNKYEILETDGDIYTVKEK